jgi:pantoate--beta-alanine ligase
VREESGLALSSRNTLLSAEEKELAVNISRVLFISRHYAKSHTLAETKAWVVETLNALDGLEVQYYEIVDGRSLESLTSWDNSNDIVGCITVFCGHLPVRLIDNVRYK